MQSLESLDISKNKMFGKIPVSLSDLTILSYLNLSNNNLSGRIPTGRQLDTLSTDNPSLMYIGNSGLCGPPLQKNCSGNDKSIRPPLQNNSSGNDKSIHGNHRNRSSKRELNPMSFYHGIIWGFVVGLWMVPCALLLNNTCRISYFRLLDKIYEKVYVFVVLSWAKLTRNSAAK